MSLAKERPVRRHRAVKTVRRRKKQTNWVVWIHKDASAVGGYYASLVPRRNHLRKDNTVVDVVDPSAVLSIETLETFVPASNAFVALAGATSDEERALAELIENSVLAAWLIARKLEQ